jgi:hypothetical protein
MTDLKAKMQSDLNKMHDHLINQGRRSVVVMYDADTYPRDPAVACAYRGDDGAMCAVGCLISDGLYDPEMENLSAYAVVSRWKLLNPEWDSDSPEAIDYMMFLNRAQTEMHDCIDVVSVDHPWDSQVLEGYKGVALHFGLEVERG